MIKNLSVTLIYRLPLAYEYDQNGWLTKIKGEIQSGNGSTEKTVRSYTYDSYGKVKEIKDYRDLLNSSDQAVKKSILMTAWTV